MQATSSQSTTPSRRRKVGGKWPGLYERLDRHGERRLEFDFYDEAGRRRWHTLPASATLKQAQAERERFRVKRHDGGRFAPAQAPRLTDVWREWLDEASVALRPRTAAGYELAFRGRIVPRLGQVKVSQLDRAPGRTCFPASPTCSGARAAARRDGSRSARFGAETRVSWPWLEV